ncbi:DUF6343 family protein [Streptosporangium canum]|uniref:DUF6343 family protein n=1 Tax=Streptosporangium canum TaxID=324952 RepID=UPI0034174F8B
MKRRHRQTYEDHSSTLDPHTVDRPDRSADGTGGLGVSAEAGADARHGHMSAGDRLWSQISPTGERPQSALNLRIALAVFGLIVCGAFAFLARAAELTGLAIVMAVLAVVALVDLVVVIRRRIRRGDGHSLFG